MRVNDNYLSRTAPLTYSLLLHAAEEALSLPKFLLFAKVMEPDFFLARVYNSHFLAPNEWQSDMLPEERAMLYLFLAEAVV